MNLLQNKYMLWGTRLFLGFIFIFAGMEKISEPASFSEAIVNYKIIPNFLINFFAITIPWIEVISGILLIFGIAIKENAVIISGFLGIFIVMILIALFRGLNIQCGCFGTSNGESIGMTKLLENIGLLILGLYILFFGTNNNKLNSSDLQ